MPPPPPPQSQPVKDNNNNNKTTKKIAHPRNHLIFDPWNSGATGHQRIQHATQLKTTAHRVQRAALLDRQFRGADNNRSVYDGEEEQQRATKRRRVGIGKEGDIRGYMLGISKTQTPPPPTLPIQEKSANEMNTDTTNIACKTPHAKSINQSPLAEEKEEEKKKAKGIFHSLTFFINGSTFPLISDHKLRHLVAEHGGVVSLAFARRSVSHVILASPAAATATGAGGGGGLSAVKLHKEFMSKTGRGGGKGVKFVRVEWIIESIKAGKRLPEARYAVSLDKNGALVGASRGQRSVYGMLRSE